MSLVTRGQSVGRGIYRWELDWKGEGGQRGDSTLPNVRSGTKNLERPQLNRNFELEKDLAGWLRRFGGIEPIARGRTLGLVDRFIDI